MSTHDEDGNPLRWFGVDSSVELFAANERARQAEDARDLALDGHRLDDEMIDQLHAEITRLRTALEAVCIKHDAKLRSGGMWVCGGCGWRDPSAKECPTQAIVHAALDAGEAT
jgi:hypothetical protein